MANIKSAKKKTRVINNPVAIRNVSEKLYSKKFIKYMPDTIFSNNIEESHKIIRQSSDLKTICSCSGLTIVFRIIEAVGILLILQALGINFIEFFNLLYMYSASVILGSISMSPGGLGVTEGSFAGLLTLYELELQTTLAIAVIVRFFTMWFAIVVGFISLKLSDLINHNE